MLGKTKLLAGVSVLLGLGIFSSVTQADSISVNTTADEINNNGNCSLREAVQSANTDSIVDGCALGNGSDVIQLPSGVFSLSAGEILLSDAVRITGQGIGSTVVDGQNTSRIFRIDDSNNSQFSAVILEEMSLQNARTSTPGGAINSRENLTLESMRLENSTASSGGALAQTDGPLTIESVLFIGNEGTKTSGCCTTNVGAGAVEVTSGNDVTSISHSAFVNNRAGQYGGAMWYDGGPLTMTYTTMGDNYARSGIGAALFTSMSRVDIDLSYVTVYNNEGRTFNGGLYSWSGGGSGVDINLQNSIVTQNITSGSQSNVDFQFGGGQFYSEGYNLVSRNLTSRANPNTDTISTAAGLAPLVVEDGSAYYHLTQASPIQGAGATPNVVVGFTFLTSSSMNVGAEEFVRLEFELGSGFAPPVTITATEIPGFLNLYDNGDGTASLEGYQVLKSSFQIILKATDDDANVVEKRFYLNPEGQISPAEEGLLLSEGEEGYDYSNKEKTAIEDNAGAINHFFALMLVLIAGLRIQRHKS
jgi:CSLREA domain-containing protein